MGQEKIRQPDKTGVNKPERDEGGRLLPGNTANPNGRPKGSVSVVDALKKELESVPAGEKKSYLELLTKKILDKAVTDGDVVMIRDIINRVDGMPKQAIENTGEQKIIVETRVRGRENNKD